MSALTRSKLSYIDWKTIAISALAFWLSGSLLIDLVFMPTMYVTGMTAEPGFAAAGYSIFAVFNRIELLCAALALTTVLILRNTRSALSHWSVPLAIGLLGIVIVYTYALAPEMSALGMQLNWFEPTAEVPARMNQMHLEYWTLEIMKFVGTGLLLNQFYRATR
jgi:hypothetical protein